MCSVADVCQFSVLRTMFSHRSSMGSSSPVSDTSYIAVQEWASHSKACRQGMAIQGVPPSPMGAQRKQLHLQRVCHLMAGPQDLACKAHLQGQSPVTD